MPGNAIGSGVNLVNYTEYDGVGTSVTQSLDYNPAQNYLTDVGAFSGSPSGYGTFDQTGNVWQWNDLDGTAGEQRGNRGGGWASDAAEISSSYTMTDSASYESATFGFRLAGGERSTAVPEIDPKSIGSVLALVLGSLGLLERRRPRRLLASTDSAVLFHAGTTRT